MPAYSVTLTIVHPAAPQTCYYVHQRKQEAVVSHAFAVAEANQRSATLGIMAERHLRSTSTLNTDYANVTPLNQCRQMCCAVKARHDRFVWWTNVTVVQKISAGEVVTKALLTINVTKSRQPFSFTLVRSTTYICNMAMFSVTFVCLSVWAVTFECIDLKRHYWYTATSWPLQVWVWKSWVPSKSHMKLRVKASIRLEWQQYERMKKSMKTTWEKRRVTKCTNAGGMPSTKKRSCLQRR